MVVRLLCALGQRAEKCQSGCQSAGRQQQSRWGEKGQRDPTFGPFARQPAVDPRLHMSNGWQAAGRRLARWGFQGFGFTVDLQWVSAGRDSLIFPSPRSEGRVRARAKVRGDAEFVCTRLANVLCLAPVHPVVSP